MKFLQKIFKKEKLPAPAWWVMLILLLAIFGAMDTLYLVSKQYTGQEVVCDIYALNGCNSVLNSEYSKLFDVPLSLWGLGYYLTVLLLALKYIAIGEKKFFKYLFGLTFFGFLFSLRLVYLQAVVLENWCFYCLLSAMTSTLLFIINLVFYKFVYKKG